MTNVKIMSSRSPQQEPGASARAASDGIDIDQPVDLVVLACKSNALRCRLLGSDREITLRTAVRDEFPGAIITVTPAKQWTHARHLYLSGDHRDPKRRRRPRAPATVAPRER